MQRRLARHVAFCHRLMGIGSGDQAASSGESRIFSELPAIADGPWCIFDVGANQGQFLQLAIAAIPQDRRVIHCFEPGQFSFERLQQVVGQTKGVRLNQLALSSEDGLATLHYDKAGSGLASLSNRDLAHFGIDFSLREQVVLTTIDRYCEKHRIERIHLLKLDIEGHELSALAGAKGMMRAGRIDSLTFEFGGCNIDSRTYFRDFWKYFAEFQMKVFRITPAGTLVAIRRYEEALEQFTTTNFFAVRSR